MIVEIMEILFVAFLIKLKIFLGTSTPSYLMCTLSIDLLIGHNIVMVYNNDASYLFNIKIISREFAPARSCTDS